MFVMKRSRSMSPHISAQVSNLQIFLQQVSVYIQVNDPAKVEGVQSFPHLGAQHGANFSRFTLVDIIFQIKLQLLP